MSTEHLRLAIRELTGAIYTLDRTIRVKIETDRQIARFIDQLDQQKECHCHKLKGEPHYHCVDCNKVLTGEDEGNRCFSCWELARNDIEGE